MCFHAVDNVFIYAEIGSVRDIHACALILICPHKNTTPFTRVIRSRCLASSGLCQPECSSPPSETRDLTAEVIGLLPGTAWSRQIHTHTWMYTYMLSFLNVAVFLVWSVCVWRSQCFTIWYYGVITTPNVCLGWGAYEQGAIGLSKPNRLTSSNIFSCVLAKCVYGSGRLTEFYETSVYVLRICPLPWFPWQLCLLRDS